MKEKTIFNIMDLLEHYENRKLDLQSDYNNRELRSQGNIIHERIKETQVKIKELKDCIKWLQNIN